MKGKDGINKVIGIVFICLAVAAVVGFIWAFVNNWTHDYYPYATGPYGSNIVRPENPYYKWMWIFPILSCVSCSIGYVIKESTPNTDKPIKSRSYDNTKYDPQKDEKKLN